MPSSLLGLLVWFAVVLAGVLVSVTPVMLFVVAVSFAVSSLKDKRRRALWDEVAASIGWQRTGDYMEGSLSGVPAALDLVHVQRDEFSVMVPRLRVQVGGQASIGLSSQRWLQLRPDIQVGDPDFDAAAEIQCEEAELGWLTHRVREAWLRSPCHVVLHEGELELRQDAGGGRGELLALFELAQVFAEEWSDGRSDGRRLEDSARTDPLPSVRARCLQARAALGDATVLAEDLMADPALEVRARAAIVLGDQAALLALAMSEETPTSVRCLAAQAPVMAPWVGKVARAFCNGEERGLWFEACKLLSAGPVAEGVEAVAPLFEAGRFEGDEAWVGRLAERAARALAAQQDPAAEPMLLQLLAREEPKVVAQAALGLGGSGTVGAVPALKARAQDFGLTSRLPSTLGSAVRAIQSRAAGVKGGLAIAQSVPEAGGVSVAESPQGCPPARISSTTTRPVMTTVRLPTINT